MKLKYVFLLLFFPLCALLAEPLRLSNEFWDIAAEPGSGGRASGIVYKPRNKELVNFWKEVQARGGSRRLGGAWGGHMSGSYNDEQGAEPYQVNNAGARLLESSWLNRYPDFDGLREDRTVVLDNRRIIMKINITNQSASPRTFMYRLQDFIGVGGSGLNQFGVVPGATPGQFRLNAPEQRERVFLKPAAGGLALCDYEDDFGLLIACRGKINGLYTWCAREGDSATIEFFMEQTILQPGESWSAEFTYQAFAPSAPDDLPEAWRPLVKPGHVYAAASRTLSSAGPLPYRAVCVPEVRPDRLRIFPVAASDNAAGKDFPASGGMSLQSMKLFGTPGERVDFVLALKAGTGGVRSPWELKDFTSNGVEWRLRYLTEDGYYLVHDRKLTRKNQELAVFGNSLEDADSWSNLELEPHETAWVKLSCRIPADAAPGLYESEIRVAGKTVKLELRIFPFRLNRENAKTFGSFFRVFTVAEKPQWNMSREEFQDALRFADANWNNGIFIYVRTKDDLLWSIGQLRLLGWRNAVICPISRLLPSREIDALEKQYGYRIMTWGVDEPSTYRALGIAADRLRQLLAAGYKRPVFTPSTFMGMLFSGLYPAYIPVFNTNGMMTVLMEKSREYAGAGRTHFWYSCPTGMLSSGEQLKERLLHGVYLWKMPVNGIFDWGEDVAASGGAYCGFAGKKLLSTIRRDNNYEGYKDYLYLKTLSETVKANPGAAAAAEARGFLDGLAAMLGDDYYNAATQVDHVFLDSIREQAARLTAALLETGPGQ